MICAVIFSTVLPCSALSGGVPQADLFNEVHPNKSFPEKSPYWTYDAGENEKYNFRSATLRYTNATVRYANAPLRCTNTTGMPFWALPVTVK